MKKLLLLFSLTLMFSLTACAADEENTNNETEQQEETTDENEDNNDGGKDEPKQSSEDVIENEAGSFKAHTTFESPKTVETGPIILTIDKIVTASGDLTEEWTEMLETDHLEYIQVDISVENTSEEDITFYAGQGTISTNTGEQLETDMFLSGHIAGDMMSGTKANDTFFYILENSNAEDVESIRFKFSAPYNTESYDDVGEELDFEINLNE